MLCNGASRRTETCDSEGKEKPAVLVDWYSEYHYLKGLVRPTPSMHAKFHHNQVNSVLSAVSMTQWPNTVMMVLNLIWSMLKIPFTAEHTTRLLLSLNPIKRKCAAQLGSNSSVHDTAVLPGVTSDARGATLATIRYPSNAKHSELNGLLRHPIRIHKTPWCLWELTLSRQNTLQNNCAVEILLEIDAYTTLIVLIDCEEVDWRATAVMGFKSATG